MELKHKNCKSKNLLKRRLSANKKERQRTEFLNLAFLELRKHLPNVPADTKLPKIKILKLAMNYIQYLENVLANERTTMCNQEALETCRAAHSYKQFNITWKCPHPKF